jgi:hypothetical protein
MDDLRVIRPSGLFPSAPSFRSSFSNLRCGYLAGPFVALEKGFTLGQGQMLLVKFSVVVELTTDPSVHFGERAADPASSWIARE